MPSHPLLNDHTISLSATLAATIGLEEAVLLTVLNDAARLQSQPHARLAIDTLRRQLPFWDDATLRRLLQQRRWGLAVDLVGGNAALRRFEASPD